MSLDIGIARQRIMRSKLEIFDAAVVLPSRLEPDRQLSGDVARVLAIGLLFARGDLALPLDSPRLRHPAAEALLVHRVHEGIAIGHRAVRPIMTAAGNDELLPLNQAIAD